MDILGIVQPSEGFEKYEFQQEVEVKILKKTSDFNKNLALELIQKLSQSGNLPTNNPSNTGTLLDIKV